MVKATSWILLIAGTLAVIALTAVEHFLWSMPILPNHAPDLDSYGFARSLLTALVALAIVAKAANLRHELRPAPTALSVAEWLAISASFCLAIVFTLMFLVSPELFSAVSLEDHFIEWSSALLPLMASLLLAWRGADILFGRRPEGGEILLGAALLLCAGILFVLGMEEISWMQRVFGFVTPGSFHGNIQGEINLHNFATNETGAVHKIGGFVVLILLPFLHMVLPRGLPLAKLTELVPGRAVALVSAPLAAFNYNGWDSLAIQMTSYLTIGIVLYFALAAWRARQATEALVCVGLAALIIGVQLLFLGLGDRFIRIWDVTEYKEFFIALGLYVWSVEIYARLQAHPASATGTFERSLRA